MTRGNQKSHQHVHALFGPHCRGPSDDLPLIWMVGATLKPTTKYSAESALSPRTPRSPAIKTL